MHYLVKLIVSGEDAIEALESAVNDANELIEQGEFDWYALDGRWGISKPHEVTSEKGKQLIEEGMKQNRQEFDAGLEVVRYMLENYSDDEIYNEKFEKNDDFYLSRYQFSRVAGYTTCNRIYAGGDIWGGKLEKDSDLEYVLTKHPEKKLWVIPIDFHN